MGLGIPMKGLGRWTATPFFWLNLGYITLLVLLLISRQAKWLLIDRIPDPIGGLIPIAVPWFGALGAVMISFYGVFDWNNQWDTRWNYWHAARPLVGAVFAVISFLIFVGVINATGVAPKIRTTQPQDALPYLVLAFIVGFREQTFRTLLQRAVDIILGPGIPGQTPVNVVLTADKRVAVADGRQEQLQLTVANSGSTDAVITNAQAGMDPSLAGTAGLTGLTGLAIPPMSHVTGILTITPAAASAPIPFKVTVTVLGTFGTRTIVIERT